MVDFEDMARYVFHSKPADWISVFCRIEDPDSGLPQRFRLWPEQRRVLDSFLRHRLVVVLKARQLGLTWLAVCYAVWRMLTRPGYRVVALSRGEKEAKELVRRVAFVLRHLPAVFAVPGRRAQAVPAWDATTERVVVYHPAGGESVYTAFPAAEDSGRAFTASLVQIDEWAFQQYAREIWAAAYPTVNRPGGGQVIGISTARRGTFFQEIWQGAVSGENGFVPVFLPWTADPRRTREWYEATARNIADPNLLLAEYPLTPEEAWSSGTDTAFPEFTREVHVVRPFEIPSWWRRWLANDPGYADHFAWHWFAADGDGNVYVYREYTNEPGERVPYSEQAARVAEMSAGERIDFCVAGMDAWNRHPETGKSIIDYYREGGLEVGFIQPVHGPQSRKLRTATLHEYLAPYEDENTGRTVARLRIFETCTKLIETLPMLTTDRNDPETVAKSALDHWYDALTYGLCAWHAERSQEPPKPKTLIQRDKERLIRMRSRDFIRRALMA